MTGVYEEQHQNHQKRRREDGNGTAQKKRRLDEEGLKQHPNLQDLPLDLIKLIFSRLSISDLFQCALLSKAWSDIILLDPNFAAMQHARAMENQEKSLGLTVFTQSIWGSGKTLYFSERGGAGPQKTTAIETQIEEKIDVGGSCNGLLYLCDSLSYDPMHVCNPITGEYMKLPEKTPHDFVISGFGFDAEKNEYKVVRILYRFPDGDEYDDEWYDDDYLGKAEIHTLGTDCWRRIGDVSHQISILNQYSDVVVNGALHWMLDTPLDSELILALDMGEEKFRTVPLPDLGLDADPDGMHLMAWKGRLSVIEHSTENTCIWVMNNYSDGTSWTKNLSVRWPTWLHRCPGQYQPFDDESMKDAQLPVALTDAEAKHQTVEVIAHMGSFLSVHRFSPAVEAIAHMGSLLSLHRFSPDVKRMATYF